MKNYRFLILILLLATLVNGCNKNKEFTIEIHGIVTDPNQAIPLPGATVRLLVKEVTGGTFNNNYVLIESTTTDGGGGYRFIFTNRNAVDYKIEISKDDYFGIEDNINPETLDIDNPNTVNYDLSPQAYFSINVKNVNPYDTQDVILYQNTNGNFGCGSCCSNVLHTLTGMTVDTTFTCLVAGHTNINFSWFVTKNGNTTTGIDSVFCPSFDTAFYTISY